MNIPRRLWLFTRSDRLALTLTVLCGFLGGLLIIGQASLFSRVINDGFLEGRNLAAEAVFFRLLILIILLRSFIVWATEVTASRFGIGLKSKLRRKLFAALLDLGPLYTQGEPTGALASTLFEGVEALGVYFSQYLPQVLLAALIPLAILVLIFPRDPLSGVILFLTAPLIPVFMALIGKGAEALTKRQWDTLSRLSAYFLDSLQGLATLKMFGQSRIRAESIARTSDQFREATLKVLRVTFLSAFVLELIATISTAMVAVEVSLRLFYGRLDFQQAFFLLLLAPEFYLPLRQLGMRFHAGMAGVNAAQRIFEILDRARAQPGRDHAPASQNGPFSSLRLNDVCFTYPGETRPVLENVNITINRGEHIALVGLSGAGKTTLAALMLGFLPASAGRIAFDGHPSEDVSRPSWRDGFGWVPANPHLFHDTLAANLRLARADATLEELEQAVRAASLEELVRDLPLGLDTVLGEEAARLSGGEAQRVAVARAFLKNAPILILDEPTSHLDVENETWLVESIRRLMQDRTVITIAHRPNAFIQADQIYVLENGRVVEKGSHPELLACNGAYARLLKGAGGPAAADAASPFLELNQNDAVEELQEAFPPFAPDHASTRYSFLSILSRLLSFLQGSWNWVALSVLLGALAIASNIGLMGTAAWLISTAALHPEFGALQIAIVAVRFFGLSRGIFRYTERLVSHEVTFRLLTRLRTWFYRALEPLAPARLAQIRAGDLLSRIIADVETLENFYVRIVAPPLTALVITVGLALFLGQYEARLAWVYLAFIAGLEVALPLISWRSTNCLGKAWVDQRAALQARLVDGLHGLADLLVFNHGVEYSRRLGREEDDFSHVQGSLASVNGFFNAWVTLGVQACLLVLLALAIPLVASGRISGPVLAALMLASQAGFEAVMPLVPAAQVLSSCTQAGKRLFAVVDARPAVMDAACGIDIRPAIPSLECRDLGFNYPGSSKPALEGVSFFLRSGSRIAIVGPSGSGKSTLASLLLRFWEIPAGQLFLNDRDVHEYAQESVRRQFSVVAQKPAFFDESVLQNLRLGNPSADESQVQRALRQAGLEDFVRRLPSGLQTRLGERGVRLSSGEARRLALARAYLKGGPIYLLDEPAANLDPAMERSVLETLFKTLGDRSLLLITHRLVGLEPMDEIIVLDKGKVVQRGTHSDLIAQSGLYSRMWALQWNPEREK